MRRFLSTHLGSLRRKDREPREPKAPTPTQADPFTIPRSVSYRKANPRLPEPRKVVSLGSVRRPSHWSHHTHGRHSVSVDKPQEAERPFRSSREDPTWAVAAGPKLKKKVNSHESESSQHPALRKGGYQTQHFEPQPVNKAPPRPPRPDETSSKPPRQEASSSGYGQTLDTARFRENRNAPSSQVPVQSQGPAQSADEQIPDTAKFRERQNTPSRQMPVQKTVPLQGAADGRKPAMQSPEQNKAIVDKVQDLSWAVESGLDLTNTVDQDESIQRLPAVIHEHVRPQVHEVREERIERHIHNYDIYPQIQPIYDLEILPARHFIEDADGRRVEVAEADLPCCTGGNQRWRIGLEALRHRTVPFAAPAPLNLQRKSEMITRKERETGGGAEVLPTTHAEYMGVRGTPLEVQQGESFRRSYRPAPGGLQAVPRILREGRESLMSDNQMEQNVAAGGTRTYV
ncbi:hypothetical protein PG985_015813 [Apiospora marii]|uniref:Uncharacterized protein n=1 Tax=Apiospora marii TaxID=335849 RepID=A0ABR1S5Q6_9PEZI